MPTPTTLPLSSIRTPKRRLLGLTGAIVVLSALGVTFTGCLAVNGSKEEPSSTCDEGQVVDSSAKDCFREVCQNGQLVKEADPTQLPDDGNPCTTDACVGVEPENTDQDGAACTLGQSNGTCKKGECIIQCFDASKCNDMNPCTEDLCDDGICKFPPNDNVKPDDKNECTDDSCTDGVELHAKAPKDTVCLTTGKCDGLGNCVGCTSDDQCGLGDECNDRKCDKTKLGGTCVTAFKTNGPTVTQNMGDCKVRECKDGMVVNVTPQVDDVPNDGNPCTQDMCNGATPTSSPEVEGYACGDNNACDGAGSCVDCAGGVGCDATETCDNTAHTCEKCTDGTKNNGESDVDCGGTKCGKCGQGRTCGKNEDCALGNCVDGVCCNGPCNGKCEACSIDKTGKDNGLCEPVKIGTSPDNECKGMYEGGCGTNHNCQCADGMKNGDETGIDCGGASCRKCDGSPCNGGAECKSNACTDGVCCESACNTECRSCNQPNNAGKCMALPKYADDDAPVCSVTKTCNGLGFCRLKNGQSCLTNIDCASYNCTVVGLNLVCQP